MREDPRSEPPDDAAGALDPAPDEPDDLGDGGINRFGADFTSPPADH